MIDFDNERVGRWLAKVWPKQVMDVEERALRFGEESLELIQSLGVTREQALLLVEQVYNKPAGEPDQELGGTTVTLASLCNVTGMDPDEAYEREFARCERPEIIEKIQRKHKEKLVVSSRQR